MNSIFIFGSTWYFGAKFKTYFEQKWWKVFSERVDIRDLSAVSDILEKYNPDVVLNSAGITGVPNVDWCESNKGETMAVNVNWAVNIAVVCEKLNKYFIHIGSGCIYEWNWWKVYWFTEEDAPNFWGSFYSRTKMISEKLLEEFNPLQLRVRIPVEWKSFRKNVIDKLLKYEKVVTIDNSFTIVEDFIPAAFKLIEKWERGIFNMTNVGYMDHEYLMENYRKIVDPTRNFTYMNVEELKQYTCAARSNCVLDSSKREKLWISMPDVKVRVLEILKYYQESVKINN